MSLISQPAVMAVVRDYLNSQSWHFQEDDKTFSLGMNVKSKLTPVRLRIICEEGKFVTYTYSNINAPEDMRFAVMQFITAANYGMRRGNFELDQRDGEIRYKSFMGLGDTLPDVDEVEKAVDIGIIMFRRYGDELMNVIFAGADPIEACKRAESN